MRTNVYTPINARLKHFLIQGFTSGFDIHFSGLITNTRRRNLLSARSSTSQVSKVILKETSLGHTQGPFLLPPFRPFHCSLPEAVPKSDGTTRLILDLSYQQEGAINDGILPDEVFSKFDYAIELIRSQSHGAFMAKLDIRSAFRLLPVRYED